ncbi:MAG: hypothetical protein NT027_17785 [Proteobacteria bacterium]|nr:hypothetical protein [Pseudomonadota bacterium]
MMKLLCACVATVFSTLALAGHEIGDGGDPVIVMFSSAHKNASAIMTEVDLEKAFAEGNLSKDVYDWLAPKRHKMIQDIESQTLVWNGDAAEQSTCARTNIPNLSETTVRLSLKHCRILLQSPFGSESLAIITMIHEATHKNGLTNGQQGPDGQSPDEIFADKIANETYKSWIFQKERMKPFFGNLNERSFDFGERIHFGMAKVSDDEPLSQSEELVIWGGCNLQILPNRAECSQSLNDGAIYRYDRMDPRKGTWTSVNPDQSPSGRHQHSIVTTVIQDSSSSQKVKGFIVYGGCSIENGICKNSAKSGGFYNMTSQTWQSLPESNQRRHSHSASMGEQSMYIFGGIDSETGKILAHGEVLTMTSHKPNINSDAAPDIDFKWEAFNPPFSFKPRYNHFSTWTGSGLIVFGGCGSKVLGRCSEPLMDGFIWKPKSKDNEESWHYISADTNLTPRDSMAVTWTGKDLIAWGGIAGSTVFYDGSRLSISGKSHEDQWSSLPRLLPPDEKGRFEHLASWDGSRQRVLYWGGRTKRDHENKSFASTLLALDLTNTLDLKWKTIQLDAVPQPSIYGQLLPTFDKLIVFGGFNSNQTFTNRGYVFFP